MDFTALRAELCSYYRDELDSIATENRERCWAELNRSVPEGLSAWEQKGMQYQRIPEFSRPRIFDNTFFYYEMGVVPIANKNYNTGTWTYERNRDQYAQVDEEIASVHRYCRSFPLYAVCGEYGDELYHFVFAMDKVICGGVRGLYEKALAALESAAEPKLKAYYAAMCKGLLALKRMSELFAEVALEKMASAKDEQQIVRLKWIADAAIHTPWNPPRTFREGLNTIAFLQKAIPALEGGSISGMGRLDQMLYGLFQADLESGRATKEVMYEDICHFLLLWDAHWDNDWKQNDIEFNDRGFTYTLGGCDRDGRPAYNPLTMLFLKANHEMKVTYPKIKCRFDKDAPKEYFDLINRDIAVGRTTILYQNDEAFIPALLKKGIAVEDARDYSLLGCWEPVIPGATNEHCGYINLLKILELSVFGDFNSPDVSLKLRNFDGADSFEEVYLRLKSNISAVLSSRCAAAVKGRALWPEIDPHIVYSSALADCVENERDLTAGGARYNLDELVCAGFPNVVDSLLAIRELCFDKGAVLLDDFLQAVRCNWEGFEELRAAALRCRFFGDESPESAAIARRLNEDLYKMTEALPALWGGRVTMGYMLFMEMPLWACNMRATPDGRRSGDYFARGLTPSGLHHIESVTSAINTLDCIDSSLIAANSVLNVTVPFGKMNLDFWDSLLRTVADSSVQALQLNCATKEELEDAQLHPEKHDDLVVRVCGFSAKFVALSHATQDEFLSRNFYGR